ncbi:MAG: hypothetical protein K8D98_01395 [Rhodanobacter sp.]|nr:hypothetical protein [Rhodanobacter sp.]
MKKVFTSILLGLIMMLLVMVLGNIVAFLKLLASGHGLHETSSALFGINLLDEWKIAAVGGVAIFLLSLVGGPRQRPPH